MSHVIELLTHPETPVFKERQAPCEVELHERVRLRRMERQPVHAAQWDDLTNCLYNVLHEKGEKVVQGIARFFNHRCNNWLKVPPHR